MKAISIVGAIALVAAANAQQPTPAEILKATPKRVALADMPESYRAVQINRPIPKPTVPRRYQYYYVAPLPTMDLGEAGALYLSMFEAVWVDPDEFQTALETKNGIVHGLRMISDVSPDDFPLGDGVPIPVFTDVWIPVGSFDSWTPRPDLARTELVRVFGLKPPPPPLPSGASEAMIRLKALTLAFLTFAEDNDGRLPKANSTAEALRQVAPYLKNTVKPTTDNPAGGRILYNTALSDLFVNCPNSPGKIPILWEEKAWPDGKRAIAYLDGHVARLNDIEWERCLRNSDMHFNQ